MALGPQPLVLSSNVPRTVEENGPTTNTDGSYTVTQRVRFKNPTRTNQNNSVFNDVER